MSFTLRQLRYFLAVSETGKITDAAVSVNISPSSITEAIKELESILGADLLERSRTGVTLTCEGYRFLQSAKKILAEVAEAKNSFRQTSHDVEGRVVICASITVSGYFLSNVYESFRRTYPNIELELYEHSRVVVERKIKRGEVDLGLLLTSNVKDKTSLQSMTMLKSHRQLWLAANHPLVTQESVSLKDIVKENYIQLLIDEAERTTAFYWKQHHLQPKTIFRTESVEAVRNMVAIGAGVTILSDMVYRPWSLDGDRVETRPIIESVPTMDTGLVWSADRPLSKESQLFIDFCRMKYDIL